MTFRKSKIWQVSWPQDSLWQNTNHGAPFANFMSATKKTPHNIENDTYKMLKRHKLQSRACELHFVSALDINRHTYNCCTIMPPNSMLRLRTITLDKQWLLVGDMKIKLFSQLPVVKLKWLWLFRKKYNFYNYKTKHFFFLFLFTAATN